MKHCGIELCDAGFQTAVWDGQELGNPAAAGLQGPLDWMGFAYHDGKEFTFGRAAEDAWLIHPRQVAHNIWGRLSRETSNLLVDGRPVPVSQLCYFFLRDYLTRVPEAADGERLVLAVPGGYLKDEATEDEKVGLLLGMASDSKLRLAGLLDMACAALCDPRLDYFDPASPVVVVDIHLHATELTLVRGVGQPRADSYSHLPRLGYAELLRQLTTSMGNRFLRHTTFDILEDGRVEQVFYRQTKDFLLSGAAEVHYQINTANRAYQMAANREQLATDAAAFVQSLQQGVQALAQTSGVRAEQCTIALTARAVALPGVVARLRAAGLGRILRLPVGAAAAGAATVAAEWPVPGDLADVAVVRHVPLDLTKRARPAQWEARLVKAPRPAAQPRPTHVVCEGVGHGINGGSAYSIGSSHAKPDCVLPEEFDRAGDSCLIRLEREGDQFWLLEPREGEPPMRTAIESGDRLTVRCGAAEAELLFVHCQEAGRGRH